MSRRGGRALERARGFSPLVAVSGLILLGAFAGIAAGDDVSFADALGELGFGGASAGAPVSETPTVLAEETEGVPWLETGLYLLTASVVLAGYVLAARKWPWLWRGRRKP